MKLSIEQIKEITVGAVEIWEEQDGLHFGKCTKAQVLAWKEAEAGLVNNAIPTTGVRLDFHTDSDFVKISLGSIGKYEVEIDGVFKEQFNLPPGIEKKEITLDLGTNGKETHVVFTLPSHLNAGIIVGVEIADSAYVKPHTFDRKILFVGDSITQGYNSTYDLCSYAYQISEYLNADSVIQGIGGAFFAPKTVLPTGYKPDIVFIAYGTNDFMRLKTLDELKKNASEYILKLQALYEGAKFFVISPVWRMDEKQPREMGTFKACCDCIKNLARELKAEVIDGDQLLPQFPTFMADTIHPNNLGFAAYALNLLKQLQGRI